MNAHEYKKALDKSMGLQLIVAGLSMLVEDEGHTAQLAICLAALKAVEGERL